MSKTIQRTLPFILIGLIGTKMPETTQILLAQRNIILIQKHGSEPMHKIMPMQSAQKQFSFAVSKLFPSQIIGKIKIIISYSV